MPFRGVVMYLNCKILSNLSCVTTKKGWMYFFAVFTLISDKQLSLENMKGLYTVLLHAIGRQYRILLKMPLYFSPLSKFTGKHSPLGLQMQ